MMHIMLCVVLIVSAVIVTVYDAKYLIIPDWVNGVLACAGFAVAVFAFNKSPASVISAAVLTVIVLTGLVKLYEAARGICGLGMGDVKFLGAASIWVGITAMPWLLLFACLGGLAHVSVMYLSGRNLAATSRIPFGPYLSLSLFAVWSLRLGEAPQAWS